MNATKLDYIVTRAQFRQIIEHDHDADTIAKPQLAERRSSVAVRISRREEHIIHSK
jgi:hypothetical protein